MSANTALKTPEAAANAPEVLGIAAYLGVSDAAAAAAFYAEAFAAQEVARMAMPGDTRIIHLHLHINGGSLMLSDPFPEHGKGCVAHSGYMLHLQVDDADAWFARAVAAGAEVIMPVETAFWGDRYGQVRDPFGVTWGLGSDA